MSITQSIKQTNDQARKLYGDDICIMVARAPAFGNDDTCILVQGMRHAEAAKAFANIKGAKFTTETGRNYLDDDSPEFTEYTYTAVTF